MENFEGKYISDEEKFEANFQAKIGERKILWKDLIQNAEVEDGVKKELIELVDKQFSLIDHRIMRSPHDWAYEFIDNIINVLGSLKINTKSDESKILLENLRDDIWDLADEIKA